MEYRLVRCDLPAEDLRIYFKGLKFKQIRVPVQRLSLILPVEEQIVNPAAAPTVLVDEVGQLEKTTRFSGDKVGDEGGLGASLEASEEVVAKNILVEKFRKSGERKTKIQKSSKTVRYLHETFTAFKALWEDCQVVSSAY